MSNTNWLTYFFSPVKTDQSMEKYNKNWKKAFKFKLLCHGEKDLAF